jgi:hypothetical protein
MMIERVRDVNSIVSTYSDSRHNEQRQVQGRRLSRPPTDEYSFALMRAEDDGLARERPHLVQGRP